MGASTTLNDLDYLLCPPASVPQTSVEATSKSKMALNRANQDLAVRLEKSWWWVRVLASIAMLSVMGVVAMAYYVQGDRVRRLSEAFRTIHYRESKALGANAIVLDEWVKSIEGIERKVQQVDGITPEEIALRLRALSGARTQAETLKKQFLATMEENEKERGQGASFTYRDPYLKREIKLDEENGGIIDLDKLRNEIKEAARLDESTKSMEQAMLSTIPLADQVRIEAEKQRNQASAQGQGDPIPSISLPAGAGPLQLPGAPPAQDH